MFCRTTVKTSRLFVAFIIVVLASCKTTQKTTQPEKVVLDKPLENEKTLLWQISGKDMQQPSYLFGTIHVIASEDFFLGENVVEKLEKCHQLVLEMDLKNINSVEVAQAAILPDDKTVKDYLSDEDYLKLESFFADSLSAPVTLFKTAYARLKPFFLQQMMYNRYLGDNSSSYEMELLDKVRDRDVSVVGLETMKEQLDYIDQMGLDKQFDMLIKSIDEGPEQAKYLDTLIAAYTAHDLQKLHQMVISDEDFKDISNTLVDDRNKKWIVELDEILKNGSAFIAVGAGHLAGENGLIQLLRKEGYTVQPISMDESIEED